jgi:hypothetical protein
LQIEDDAALANTPTMGIRFQGAYTNAGATATFGGITVQKANTSNGDLASNMFFSTRNTSGTPVTAITIDKDQQVGIGGTPSRRLESINTNAGADTLLFQLRNNSSDASTSSSLRFVNSTSGTSSAGGAEISSIRNANDGGSFTIKTAQDSSATLTTAMTIDSSQNVGIGIVPVASQKLQVKTASDINFSVSAVGSALRINSVNDAADATAPLEVNSSSVENFGALTQRLYVKHMHSDGTTLSGWVGTGSALGSAGNTDLMLRANGSLYFTVNNSGTSDNTRLILDDNSRISLSNNDIGGTAGEDSTTGNTLLGYLAGGTIDANTINNTFVGHKAGSGSKSDAQNNTAFGAIALSSLTSGDSNVAIGYSAGENLTSGGSSVMIGNKAGEGVSTSFYHVLIGDHAGNKTLGDHGTTAVGYYALANATSGGYNTAIGYQSLEDNVAGEFNVGLGYQTLKEANSNQNTAIGYQSGMDVTSGIANTLVGSSSGMNLTSGSNNVAIGDTALATATDSANIVAIGIYAADAINDPAADGTVAIGRSSLSALTSGAENVAVGYQSADALTTGGYNTALGHNSLSALVGGQFNTAIGRNALTALGNNETSNIGIGANAMGACNEGTGSGNQIDQNIAIGVEALTGANFGSTGSRVLTNNIAIGGDALNSTGTNSQTGTIAIGFASLTALTSGAKNTAIGYQSAGNITTGSEAVIIGYQAGASSTIGNKNVLLGVYAGNTIVEDSNNTAVGYSALLNANGGGSDGSATDTNNTAIGYNSGDVITTGTNNTCLGANTDPSANNASNQTVIGQGATGQADNSVTLGNASVTDVYASQDGGAFLHATGIKFPATQNASSGANALDDYEEGTYTPVVSNGSSNYSASVENGYYTKIGDQVFVQANITSSEAGSGGTLQVSLPFNYNGTGNKFITASVRYGGLDLDANCVQLMLGNSSSGTSNLLFFSQQRDDNTQLNLSADAYSSGDTFQFNVHYKVA